MSRVTKQKCMCCGYLTIDKDESYDICKVCFWEDDAYLFIDEENIMDIPSGANHGLTLRQGKENYKKYGACTKEMIPYVRKPKKSEIPK